MSELLASLLGRLGLLRTLLGVGLGVLVVCGAIYVIAEPGTPIGLGPFSFTKPAGEEAPPRPAPSVDPPGDGTAPSVSAPLPPSVAAAPPRLPALVIPNTPTNEKAAEAAKRLREERKVRALLPMESDRKARLMPNGTWGWIFYSCSVDADDDYTSVADELLDWGVQLKGSDSYLQLHRLTTGEFWFVAFATEGDAARITRASSAEVFEISLSAIPTAAFNTLVSLPIDSSMRECSSREIQFSEGDYPVRIIDLKISSRDN
jgi:hypothetical protein